MASRAAAQLLADKATFSSTFSPSAAVKEQRAYIPSSFTLTGLEKTA